MRPCVDLRVSDYHASCLPWRQSRPLACIMTSYDDHVVCTLVFKITGYKRRQVSRFKYFFCTEQLITIYHLQHKHYHLRTIYQSVHLNSNSTITMHFSALVIAAVAAVPFASAGNAVVHNFCPRNLCVYTTQPGGGPITSSMEHPCLHTLVKASIEHTLNDT